MWNVTVLTKPAVQSSAYSWILFPHFFEVYRNESLRVLRFSQLHSWGYDAGSLGDRLSTFRDKDKSSSSASKWSRRRKGPWRFCHYIVSTSRKEISTDGSDFISQKNENGICLLSLMGYLAFKNIYSHPLFLKEKWIYFQLFGIFNRTGRST